MVPGQLKQVSVGKFVRRLRESRQFVHTDGVGKYFDRDRTGRL